MSRFIRRLPVLLLASITYVWLFAGCTTENPSSATTDIRLYRQTPASAIIFETNGSTPAVGANVTLFEAGSVDRPPVATSATDSTGRMTVSDLPQGEYDVWVEKQSFVLFQKKVVITPTFSTLHDDTLEFPSQLILRTGLQPFHDARTITVHLAGSDRSFTSPDAQGWITIEGLAQGVFTLFFESALPGYIPAERTVTIRALSIDSLRDTVTLAYTGLPAVTGIKVQQDTVSGLVTISWPPPACRAIQDFVLFRGFCSDTAAPLQPFASTPDTFFHDDNYCHIRADSLDTARRCYTYYVVARNNLQQSGVVWNANKLTYAPKSLATTFFTSTVRWTGSAFSTTVNDTAVFTVNARNRTRALRRMQWFDPSGKDTLATRDFTETRNLGITDSLRHVFGASGRQNMLAIVTDEAGTVWVDTLNVWLTGTVASGLSAQREVR